MALLPGRNKMTFYAEGGKLALGYESQLGATIAKDGAGAAVGDALYQNLPPLAVPYVHVAPANLDGIRAEAAAEGKEKADKLQEEVRKMLREQLKDAKMGAAQREDLSQRGQHFLGQMEQALRQDPAMFASPANRVAVFNQLEREISAGRITSGVNNFTNSQKLREQLKDGREAYAAYDRNGKRLNVTNKEALDAFESDTDAEHLGRLGVVSVKKGANGFYDFGEFNVAAMNGTEQDGLKEFDTLINTIPTSTSGNEHAGVGVEAIRGSGGEKYTVAGSNSSQHTTNLPHIQELRAKLIGYTGKDKKYHPGDWKNLVSENARYGLQEPRLTKYDNLPLQKGEKVTIDIATQQGEMQQLSVLGGASDNPLAGRSRRELLRYLEQNPTPANRQALAQLEQNRTHLADREITNLLATRLGLKLVDGTVRHESVSAAHLPVPAAEKTAELPSNLFPALNAGSPAFNKDAENGSYPVLGTDGKPVLTSTTGADGKPKKAPMKINPSVTVIKGIEGVQDWANGFIWRYGSPGKAGDNTERLTLADLPKQMAVYHVTPQGIRQVQGGNQVGQLSGARNFKVVGQDNTLTWLPSSPQGGMQQYQQTMADYNNASAGLKKQLDAGRITQAQYQQGFKELQQKGTAAGLMPYLTVSVATTENELKAQSKAPDGQNDEKYAGPFGHFDQHAKAQRPDQHLGVFSNDRDKLGSQHGWQELSGDDEKQYGISNTTLGNGLFGKSYVTKMLVPAINLQFNSSSKVVNQNVRNQEIENQQEKAVEVGTNYQSGSW